MACVSQCWIVLALCALIHVCHATSTADLERCPPGSGRPRLSALSSPQACTPDTSTTLLSYGFDNADDVGFDSGIYANHASAFSVEISTDHVKQGLSSAVMTNTNYLQLPSINLDHDEISIAFWIQVDLDVTIQGSWNRIFRLSNSDSNIIECGFFRNLRPGSMFFAVGNPNSETTYSQVDPVSDYPGVGDANTAEIILQNHEWYHVAWSMSASKQEWHINVSDIGAWTFTGMLTHHKNIYNDNVINSKTGKNCVGFIDLFQIYTQLLDAEAVKAIRANEVVMVCAEEGAAPVSTACEACTPGFFSANGTTCDPCAPGSISTHFNATECELCNSSTMSFRGSSECFNTADFMAATGCLCST